jgi:hypothetical protein
VYGVYDDEIHHKLFGKAATLTLDQAIDILRVAEAASQQATNLKTDQAAAIQALAKSSYKKGKIQKHPSTKFHQSAKDRPSGKQPKNDSPSEGCWNCGSETRHSRQLCPANGKECGKCSKIDRFTRVCKSKKSKKPPQTGCCRWLFSREHQRDQKGGATK